MKTGVFVLYFLLIVFLIGFVSAEVRINEASPRTPEYIELYNNGTSNISLINWIIGDLASNDTFSLNISASGFALIVDSSEGCSYYNISNENCAALSSIGSGLNDGTEQIHLYDNNSILISSFNWTSSNASLSWQYCSGNWLANFFTSGTANNCTTSTPTCTQNWSCTNWGTCSNNNQTRTCTDTNSCGNITGKPVENQTCTSTSGEYIELNWTEEIFNQKEFDIEVDMFNLLSQSYDAKVWITSTNNDTTISEIYDTDSDDWKSGTYYLTSFISGAANKTKDVKLRLKSGYENFSGNARIFARLRYDGAIIDDYEKTITISSSNSSTALADTAADTNTSATATNNQNDEGIIVLGSVNSSGKISEKTTNRVNSIIYKSKMEYIKDYAPYLLSAVCILIIILLMIDKKAIRKLDKTEEK